jgi:hypothetical protein
MVPSTVKSIGKKKKRREMREGASSSVAASGACEPKQRKRKVQRENPRVPGVCTPLSLI